MLLTLGNGGLTYGEQSVESGLAALLVATVPLWMLAADRVLNGRTITLRAMAALALGVIGVAVLARPSPAGTVTGVVIILAASASWGAGSVLSQRLVLPARPLVGSAMQMLVGGGLLLVLSVAFGEWSTFTLDQVSWASFAALALPHRPGLPARPVVLRHRAQVAPDQHRGHLRVRQPRWSPSRSEPGCWTSTSPSPRSPARPS